MINYFVIVIAMTLAIWLTKRFGLIDHCKLAIRLASQANNILFDKSLTDLDKELKIQHASKKLIIQLCWILCSGAGALLLPLLPLFALSTIDLINMPLLLRAAMSIEGLLLFALLGSLSLIKVKRG